MGCDVHFYVEKREDGKWISADKWTRGQWDCRLSEEEKEKFSNERERIRAILDEVREPERALYGKGRDDRDDNQSFSKDNDDRQYDTEGIVADDDSEWIDVKDEDRFYDIRNYNLFAILAGVRNYRGDGGEFGYNPISEPRGLPKDVSPEVRAASDQHGEDGHSHSWLTLAELLSYDWNQIVRHIDIVGALEFAYFEKTGKAFTLYFDGPEVQFVSPERMREEVARYRPEIDRVIACEMFGPEWDAFEKMLWEQPEIYFTQVTWEEKYADVAREFLDETIPKLKALGAPEDVRIVFFFDN